MPKRFWQGRKEKSEDDSSTEATSESEDTVLDLPRSKDVEITTSNRLDSFSSVTSIYSADGGKGHYCITGKIQIGVWFKNDVLFVRVVKAERLGASRSEGQPDPYVKTYLLPDRSKLTKRKTGIQRKTSRPVYNEILKNKLLSSDIKLRTLLLGVWDWDKYGRNKFLGEIRLPLSEKDLTDSTDRWYKLQEKSELDPVQDKGKLKVAIKFSAYASKKGMSPRARKGSLFVAVKEATGLPIMDPNGLSDASVKLYLLPSRSALSKKTTRTINNDLNPSWQQEFEFKRVSLEDLASNRVLEFTVWDYDRRGCKDFIGCLRLGPNPATADSRRDWMDSVDEEVEQWEAMLGSFGQWVEFEHHLRPSIQSLGVSGGNPVTTAQGVSTTDGPTGPGPPQEQATPPPHQDMNHSASSNPHISAALPLSSFETEDDNDDDLEGSLCGSKLSLYSESCAKGNYTISGEVCISLEFRKGRFRVTIHDARGLVAADSNGFSDPYVKTYLLPDRSKHSKRKTDIKKKTLDPVYNETLIYDVEESVLSSRTLLLSVWDWDIVGKNEFLGEVRIPLSDVDLTDCKHQLFSLQDTDNFTNISSAAKADYRGKLQLALMFDPTPTKKGKSKGILHVHIKNAKSLPNMDTIGYTDGFVRMSLLPNRAKRKKTCVVNDDLNPVWNEKFTFTNVSLDELSTERVLELTAWDHDTLSSNDFIGCLRLGPTPGSVEGRHEWMDSSTTEAKHWEDMLACPGQWAEATHSLRLSMDPRKFDSPAVVIEEAEGTLPHINEEGGEEENLRGSFRPRVSVLVDRKRNRPSGENGGLVHEMAAPNGSNSEESLTKEEYLNPAVGVDNWSPSPSPIASPLHLKHYNTAPSLQAGVGIASGSSPAHVKHHSSFPQLNLGDAARKGLYSSSQDQPVIGSRGSTSRGDYCITGEVLCSVSYKSGQLTVYIDRARGLATTANNEPPSPYVEVLLLPESGKNPVKQTAKKMGTSEPEFSCNIVYKVPPSQLATHILWLRVWDSNEALGKRFLGELNLLLAKKNVADASPCWYSLHNKVESEACELYIAMKFQTTTAEKRGKSVGNLHILFKQAKNLPTSDCNIKCSLISGSAGKRKGSCVNCESLPICNEELIFQKLKLHDLAAEKALEVTLWNQSEQIIGGLRLGPAPGSGKRKEWMDSSGGEVRHWESVMARPGEWQEAWHRLRTIMDPKSI